MIEAESSKEFYNSLTTSVYPYTKREESVLRAWHAWPTFSTHPKMVCRVINTSPQFLLSCFFLTLWNALDTRARYDFDLLHTGMTRHQLLWCANHRSKGLALKSTVDSISCAPGAPVLNIMVIWGCGFGFGRVLDLMNNMMYPLTLFCFWLVMLNRKIKNGRAIETHFQV